MREVSDNPALDRPVRLPRTAARRGAVTYVKLLEAVAEHARTGFDWRGAIRRPGSAVWRSELPRRAVALERTECDVGPDPAGRRVWASLYIVWFLDPSGAWREIARGAGDDSLAELAPAARRALGEGWRIVRTADEAAERIRAALDRELGAAPAAERWAVLARVHDELAARMVEEQAWGVG